VFGLDQDDLKIMLIQRDLEPFRGEWALPGGFVRVDETLEEAALRELEEETGLERVYLEQLRAFSAVDRDPRERVVSVAFFALVKLQNHRVKAATDARDAAWFSIGDIPSLAFDHQEIVDYAIEQLRIKTRREPIGVELLPPKFTLTELQRLYETVLERPLDKRNFRKKVLATGLLVELDEVEKDVSHRAARLYRFDRRRYDQLRRQGIDFEP
ncbi:MAG: NUDIX hydrolase, partial [Polyangiaceae bacterium]